MSTYRMVESAAIGFMLAFVESQAMAGGNPTIDKVLAAYAQPDPLPSYEYAITDLNDDNAPDAVVLITDAHYCGSGGCSMLVLRGGKDSFEIVSSTSISRKPIWVLGESRNGWKSLSVFVSGGGIKAGNAILRFNGKRYPGNPSLQPTAKPSELFGATELAFK